MTVTLESSYLSRVFTELGIMFKNNEQFRAINLTTKNGKLYINANTGIRYEACTDVETNEETSVNVLFQDVSEILGQRGTVKLELMPTHVLLTYGLFQITFSMANESVTPMFNTKESGDHAMFTDRFVNAYKHLSNTATLRKGYKLDPYLCYDEKCAYTKFPTVWVRTNGCGLSISLDRATASIIERFFPTSYSINDDTVLFYNSYAVLCVPYKQPVDDNFDKMIPTSGLEARWDFEPVVPALKKILKVVGEGMCTITLGKNGFLLRVMRKGVNTVMSFGDVTELSKVSVQIPLEVLLNISMLANTQAAITYREGLLWITTQSCGILISVAS